MIDRRTDFTSALAYRYDRVTGDPVGTTVESTSPLSYTSPSCPSCRFMKTSWTFGRALSVNRSTWRVPTVQAASVHSSWAFGSASGTPAMRAYVFSTPRWVLRAMSSGVLPLPLGWLAVVYTVTEAAPALMLAYSSGFMKKMSSSFRF